MSFQVCQWFDLVIFTASLEVGLSGVLISLLLVVFALSASRLKIGGADKRADSFSEIRNGCDG